MSKIVTMQKQLLFFVCCLIITSGFAQSFKLRSRLGVSEQYNVVGPNEKIQFNPSAAKNIFGLNASSDLVLVKTESDKLGFIHYRFYQSYKNVPVEKSMFIVHTKNGLLKSMNGNIITEFDPTAKKIVSVSADKAIALAIAKVDAAKYAWQDPGMQQRIKLQTKNPTASYYPKAELVYYNPQGPLMPREIRLCYKVDVYAVKPLSRAVYFIDAKTGKIVGRNDKIYNSDVTGTAHTAYSGDRTIHSDKTGTNSYRLRDLTKGKGVITLHGEDSQFGNEYTSTTPDWTLTGTNIAALDAHYGVSETYNYYMNSFGRNSYDGAGAALYSYVNVSGCDNAFWDGTSMNFLSRCNGNPGGVTAIDVAGHELTHGVTQETCGLIYAYESGAMNESLSDIMGKSVQFIAKPDDINWELSNDMNWVIRNLSNPNAEGQPDTYKGLFWFTGDGDNGGVHYNSGVGNFMFYLLVTGGTGTNDKGNNYSVAAIGLSKADQIIYRSQSVYLTENSQYADWRTACVAAATDLYGGTSQETNSVKNAFYAVGIGSDSTGCDAPGGLTATSITKTTATLKWAEAGTSVGYNLQYKVITSGKWKTVSDLTTTSYDLTDLTAGFSYQFRVQNKCTSTTTSGYSEPFTFTTVSDGPTYCASSGGSTSFEYIDRVGLRARSYQSGNNNGYGNFISGAGLFTAGTNKDTLLLTPGFPGSTWTENWAVYVDFNQDGMFDSTKEFAGAATSDGMVKIPISTPAGAKNGPTRLRVQMAYNAADLTGPCAAILEGEVEDYTAYIQNGSSVAGKELNAIMVSPNPVKGGTATASLNLAKQGNVTIRITDLSGSVLSSQRVSSTLVGKNSIALNGVGKLNSGAYMVVAEQNGIVIARAQLLIDK
jgi:Zn-dependent metalloprotease